MLGSRTKQVNSYGRRGSRIVNVSDRQDQESAGSSEESASSDVDARKDNPIIRSPAKHWGHRGLSQSRRRSPLAQNRIVRPKAMQEAPSKRTQSKLVHNRQPLTPLRPNGAPSNQHSPIELKGKYKGSPFKLARTTLRPHVPVIAVDIVVLDEEGNTLTQERRLSRTDIQPNPARTEIGKGETIPRVSPHNPLPITSDDSDLEVASTRPAAKRWKRRPYPIIISSDDSEVDGKGTVHQRRPVSLAKPRKLGSSRVEVVIPPSRKPRVANKLPSLPPPSTTLPGTPTPSPVIFPLYLAPPFPIPKTRQLTPIRSSSSRSVFCRPTPTLSTPTEADLSLDLAQLDISDATIEIDNIPSAQLEYLMPLLNECAQTSPYEFSAFIETFPFDPIVQSSAEDQDTRFRKIGEASYSEVFGIGDVVLKVIPVRFEDELSHPGTVERPASSDARDVLKEIIVTREVGGVCDTFVRLLKTYVVRGRYPSLFLDLWDEYNERKGSESIRPDSFGLTQVYAIIILPNGGPDLESYVFKNVSKSGWHQACGIFWQVVRALEQAERFVSFEHRDLHWGQILVKSMPVKQSKSICATSRVAMDDARFGVEVTIIDLGLSRMNAQDTESHWTPFDDEIFEGEGDYQYDIYRMMKDLIGNAWKSYHPLTNVMWLHYLVTKLLCEKRLKLPGGKRRSGGDNRGVSSTGYEEHECYDCLTEMEKLLGSCIVPAQDRHKARRKMAAPTSGPGSARDVIAYGVRRGWVQ